MLDFQPSSFCTDSPLWTVDSSHARWEPQFVGYMSFMILTVFSIAAWVTFIDKSSNGQLLNTWYRHFWALNKILIENDYFFLLHPFFMLSKILIAGPHLSGLGLLGHSVTVGNVNSCKGYAIESTLIIVGFSFHTRMYTFLEL